MVGTTTAEALRQAGFEIVPNPTSRFATHGAQELAISDVQIWSDGSFSCTLQGPARTEMNGNLDRAASQPVRD